MADIGVVALLKNRWGTFPLGVSSEDGSIPPYICVENLSVVCACVCVGAFVFVCVHVRVCESLFGCARVRVSGNIPP